MLPEILSTDLMGLSRIDTDGLSQQTCMELVIADFDELPKSLFQDANGEFLDITEWDFIKCDADGNVTDIYMNPTSYDLHLQNGSDTPKMKINFNWLPRTVLCIDAGAYAVCLSGTFETFLLPPNLKIMVIPSQNFSGTVDFTKLPNTLTYLDFYENEFESSVNLSHLPNAIEVLSLRLNSFFGSVALDNLPRSLVELGLANWPGNPAWHLLWGTLAAKSLPEKMENIDLSVNAFEGSLVLSDFPAAIENIELQNNKFSGEISLQNLRNSLQLLNLSNNKLSGNVNFEGLPPGLRDLDLDNNPISGTVCSSSISKRFSDSVFKVKISCSQTNKEEQCEALVSVKETHVLVIKDD